MIGRIKRGAAMILAACMLAAMLPAQTVYAANAKLAFSDPSATVGGQVSVNMKITSAGGDKLSSADVTVTYDANALEFISGTDAEGGSGKVRIHGDGGTPNTSSMTFVLKFNARAAGTTKIEVSNQEIYDSNSQLVTLDKQGSSTVTVGALATASKDATLKSLKISPGTLTPEFSPDVDTYAVTVGMDVDKIIVSAEANDENATKVIKGNEGLQMGENRVTCLVTAQDGETTKEYVIVVTKAEGGATAAADGNSDAPVKLSSTAKTITIMEPDVNTKLPDGFVETLVDIDGHKVKGWVWSSDKDRQYCVVYGMNEAGEKNFYRYDLGENEKTIQRYFQDPAADMGVSSEEYETLATSYNSLLKDYNNRMIVMIVLAVVAVILLILFIWQILSKGNKGGPDRGPGSSRGSKRRKEPVEAEESGYPEDEYDDGPYDDDEDMPGDDGYDRGYGEETVTRETEYELEDLDADDETARELRYEPHRRPAGNRRMDRHPRGEAAGEYQPGSVYGEEAGKRPRPSRAGASEGYSAHQARSEEFEDIAFRPGAPERHSARPVRSGEFEDTVARPSRAGAPEGYSAHQARSGEFEDIAMRPSRERAPERHSARPSRGEGYEEIPPRGSYADGYEDIPVRPSRNAAAGERPAYPVRSGAAEERPAREQAAQVRRGRPEIVREQPARPAARPAADRPSRAPYPAAEEYPAAPPRPAAERYQLPPSRAAGLQSIDIEDDFDLVDIE